MIGASTLITVASLAATTAGWAWIAHTEGIQQEIAADAAVTAEADAPLTAASLSPLILAPIPTLAPHRPPAAQPAAVVERAPAAQGNAAGTRARRRVAAAPALIPTAEPPLRAMNEDSAALLVPQSQSQMQAAAPVVGAPQTQPAPAPVTRTRTSRRRTR
jgi:hypothetical protein